MLQWNYIKQKNKNCITRQYFYLTAHNLHYLLVDPGSHHADI